MFMNENSGRLEVKPIEDVARLELGPERIEEIIRHINDAIKKIKSSGETDKEEMIRDLEEARKKAQGLLSEYLKSPEPKSLKEIIH